MKDVEMTEMKNGCPAAKGKCTICDCGMFKIMKKGDTIESIEAAEAAEAEEMDKAA